MLPLNNKIERFKVRCFEQNLNDGAHPLPEKYFPLLL